MAMEQLLGATLVTKGGEKPTAEALAGVETVGIYFSAHWCGPCRGFTPKLAEAHKALQAEGKKFEIVFVSSDRDQASFDEYYGEQPWMALPFADRDGKDKLSKKYKVRGIPSLVIVDAATGKTITDDGRGAVADLGKYPWTPPTLPEMLAGGFVDKAGDKVSVADLAARGTTHLGFYFSAHWCPPCRGFTPELIKSYEAAQKAGHKLEIAFVSSDKDQASFDEYYGEMPWLALPFSDRENKEALSSFFSVSGIPSFVMCEVSQEGTLKVTNKEARGAVGAEEEPGERFPWEPVLVDEVSNCDSSIEDTPSFVAFMEEAGDKWDAVEAAMTAVAERAAKATPEGEDAPFRFWTAKESGGGPAAQIRKLCGLGARAKAGEVKLVLLNLAEGGSYHVAADAEVTEASLQALMDGLGGLEWAKIKN